MTVDDVYEYFGKNWSEACRELKLGKNTSRAWVLKGYIPIYTQLRIEKLTDGKLLADVARNKEIIHGNRQ